MDRLLKTVIVIALLAVSVGGCGSKAPSRGTTAADSTADAALLAASDLATAAHVDLTTGVPVSGTLAPGWQANITSPFDDLVNDVLVREGESVAAGQVLARFRDELVASSAASARARLKSAAADYERQRNLLAEGAVSQRDLEAAESAWRAAQADEAGAAKRLADATVRAPRAGVVTTRSVQAGSRVRVGDPLFVVADTRSLEFEASVPSEYVSSLRPGAAVRLSVAGFSDGSIRGKVARVNAQADAATRQVKVYVNIPNADRRSRRRSVRDGQRHHARGASRARGPSAAIRREGDTTVVWVLANGRLAKRTVRTALRDEARDLVEVLDGLADGDRVVIGTVEGFTVGRAAQVAGGER
jgi:RND family efflux transporter MFP subunit